MRQADCEVLALYVLQEQALQKREASAKSKRNGYKSVKIYCPLFAKGASIIFSFVALVPHNSGFYG